MGGATTLVGLLLLSLLLILRLIAAVSDGSLYDYSAYTECKFRPEPPLYGGGVLHHAQFHTMETRVLSTKAFSLVDTLTAGTKYSFSCWVKIEGTDSALVKVRLSTEDSTSRCIGTVLAKSGCWSFLKGGFVLDSSSNASRIHLQSIEEEAIEISVASASLQPFTAEQWRMHQQHSIRKTRKRSAIIHVSDTEGNPLIGASVSVRQLFKDFPFGSAIAKTILENSAYQTWFVDRFNAAVFENELKWYATEPEPGKLNYTLADKMLEFVRANQIVVRGHNIFWEDPKYTPAWVRNLTSDGLRSAVESRIQSLMSRYSEEFVHWDVSNEMLHFDFYEQSLGPNASLHFFDTAQRLDPMVTVFMNDFNVIETCNDENSTVDLYISRLRELAEGGAIMEGIGLEAHFSKPNIPFMRAVIDKLATLNLPIWLTEVDISNKFDPQTQAKYLEEVLREGFSHPSVNGIMLWTALHPNGCYQMCLTDNNLHNLPAGDVVDMLLQEWETKETEGVTDDHGSYGFTAFLGEYKVSARFGNKTIETTLSLNQGVETRHFNIQM